LATCLVVWLRRSGAAALMGLALAACALGPDARGSRSVDPAGASGERPGLDLAHVEPRRDWAEAVLYFVVLDRFADGDPDNNLGVNRTAKGAFHGGDLRGLREQLDELAELGITAIWITPVVTNIPGFVTGAGFPDWGYHGYWADDFTSIDPRFGSEEELRALVEAARERGIAVLLDVVYNHVGYDSKYERTPSTRRWLRTPADGTCGDDDITSCLAGLPDLLTEESEVAEYLFEAHLGLARRVGLAGFRLDTVKHVAPTFWLEHRRRTRAELGEDFFLLGEVWGGDAEVLDPYFAADSLDAGFDFGFAGSAIAFVQGRGRVVAFDAYLSRRRNARQGYHLAHYLSTHDVPGALHQLGGDQELFRLVAVLQLTVSGIPTIFYGEEVGRLGGEWPDNRSDMPWGDRMVRPGAGLPRDEALRDFYRTLIWTRRDHPALWRGSHRGLVMEGDTYVFERRDHGDVVLVAINRGLAEAHVELARPPEWSGRVVVDVLSGEQVEPADTGLAIRLGPRQARVLVGPHIVGD
jgi:alpha-amylase